MSRFAKTREEGIANLGRSPTGYRFGTQGGQYPEYNPRESRGYATTNL